MARDGETAPDGEREALAAEVLELLRKQGLTLGTAESLTGGLLGATITAVPGASDVFRGSLVTYASELKFELLDVPRGPVVSAACAEAMAAGARARLRADAAMSTTGVAGPARQEGHAPGTVFVGIALPDGTSSIQLALSGDRNTIRDATVAAALRALRDRLVV